MTSSFQPQPEWQQWSNVPLPSRTNLPDVPGIYAVSGAAGEVWYVGKASNLRNRWGGRSHHRYGQLIRQNKKRGYQIYYRSCSLSELDVQEKHYMGYGNDSNDKGSYRLKRPPESFVAIAFLRAF